MRSILRILTGLLCCYYASSAWAIDCASSGDGALLGGSAFDQGSACGNTANYFIAGTNTITWDGTGGPVTGNIEIQNAGTNTGILRITGAGGTLSGALALSGGTLDVDFTTTLAGTLIINTNSTFDLSSTLTYNGPSISVRTYTFTIGGTGFFANTNDIILDETDSSLKLTGSGIINKVTIGATSNVGKGLDIDGSPFINTLVHNQSARVDIANALTIDQSFNIAAGQTFTLTSTGNLILNNGVVLAGNLATEQPMTLAGTISIIEDAIFDLAADLTYTTNSINIGSSILTISGTGSFLNSNDIILNNIDSLLKLTGSGTINKVTIGATSNVGKGLDIDGSPFINTLAHNQSARVDIANNLTIDQSFSIAATQTLTLTNTGNLILNNGVVLAGNLAIEQPMTLSGTFSITGDSLFDLAADLTYTTNSIGIGSNTLTISGTGSLVNNNELILSTTNSLLKLTGSGTINSVTIGATSNAGKGLDIDGTPTITTLAHSQSAQIDIANALTIDQSLSIAPGQTLTLANTGYLILNNGLVLAGTLAINQPMTLAGTFSIIEDSIFDLAADLTYTTNSINIGSSTLTISGTGSFNNSNDIILNNGNSLLKLTGSGTINKVTIGAISNVGKGLDIDGSPFINTLAHNQSARVDIANALTIDQSFSISSTQTFTLANTGSLILNNGVVLAGTLVIDQPMTLAGTFSITGDSLFDLAADLTYTTNSINIGSNTLTISGTGSLVNSNELILNTTNSLLKLTGSGTINSVTIGATSNAGKGLDINGTPTITTLAHSQSAQVDIANVLTIGQSLSIGPGQTFTLTNTGHLILNNGMVLAGSLAIEKPMTLSGTFSIAQDATFDLAADLTYTTNSISIGSSTLTISGTGSFVNSNDIILNDANSLLKLTGSGTINKVTIDAASNVGKGLDINGTPTINTFAHNQNSRLDLADTLTIEQSFSIASGQTATLTNTGGLVLNNGVVLAGTLDIDQPMTLAGTFSITGDALFDLAADLTYTTNSINIGSNTLTISGTGALANNNGVILNDANSLLQLTGSGTINSVTIDATSNASKGLDINSPLTINTLTQNQSGRLDLADTLTLINALTIGANQTFTLTNTGNLILSSGMVLNGGTLAVDKAMASTGALSISANSVFDLSSTLTYHGASISASSYTFTISGTGSLLNDNPILMDHANGTLKLALTGTVNKVSLSNNDLTTGKIDVDSEATISALDLNSRTVQFDLASSLSISDTITVANGKTLSFITTDGGTLKGAGYLQLSQGTLNVNVDTTLWNTFTHSGTSTINIANGKTLTYRGSGFDIGTGKALTLQGSGTFSLANAISLTNGILDLNDVILSAGEDVTISSDITLSTASTMSVTAGKTLTYNGTAISLGTSTLTISGGGAFSNSGSAITLNDPDSLLVLNGTGTIGAVTISSTSNTGRGLDVNESLEISSLTISSNPNGSIYLDIATGKILTIGSAVTIPDQTILSLTGGGTLDLNGNLILGNLAGTGSVDVTGISVTLGSLATTSLTLTTSNTTIVIPAGKTFTPVDSPVHADIQLAGGTLHISSPTTVEGHITHTAASTINLAAALTYSIGNSINIGSLDLLISGTGGFTNSNPITLDQTDSLLRLTGSGTINSVTIGAASDAGRGLDIDGTSAISTVAFNNSSWVDIAQSLTITNVLVVSSGRTLSLSNTGDLIFSNGMSLAGTLDVDAAMAITGPLSFTADSLFDLSSTLTYDGASISLSAYTFTISGTGSLLNANPILLDHQNGVLKLATTGTVSKVSISGTDLSTGKIQVTNPVTISLLDLNSQSARLDLAHSLTISDTVTIASGKTLSFVTTDGGTLTGTGYLQLSGGTLDVEASTILRNTFTHSSDSTINIASGKTLTYYGSGFDIGTGRTLTLQGNGTFTLANSVTFTNGTLNFSGVILSLEQDLGLSGNIQLNAASTINVASGKRLTYTGSAFSLGTNTLTISGAGEFSNSSGAINLDNPDSLLVLNGAGTVGAVTISSTSYAEKGLNINESLTISNLSISGIPNGEVYANIASGKTLSVDSTLTIPDQTVFTLSGVGTLDLNGILTLGNLVGTGSVDISSISLTLGKLATSTLSITTSNTSIVIPNGTIFTPVDSPVYSDIQLAGGTLFISSPTTVTGHITHTAASTIDLAATLTYSTGNSINIGAYDLTISGTGGLANSNDITLNSSDSLLKLTGSGEINKVAINAASNISKGLDVSGSPTIVSFAQNQNVIMDISNALTIAHSLNIASGQLTLNNIGNLFLNTGLYLAGTLNIDQPMTLSGSIHIIEDSLIDLAAAFTYSTSSISIGSSALTISGTGFFNNSQAIILSDPDSLLRLTGSGTINSVTIGATGNAGRGLDIDGTSVINTIAFNNSSWVDIAQSLTITNVLAVSSGRTLSLSNTGDLIFSNGMSLAGTLDVDAAMAITGPLSLSADSLFDLSSTLTYDGASISLNAYTFTISGTGSLLNANPILLDHQNSVLKLSTTGTVSKVSISGTDLSTGKIQVTNPVTISLLDLNSQSARLDLAHSLTISDTVTVASGKTLSFVTTDGGTLTGAGYLQLSGGTLDVAASTILRNTFTHSSDSTINIASGKTLTYYGSGFDIGTGRTLTLLGNGTFTLANSVSLTNGTLDLNDIILAVEEDVNLTSDLTLSAASTINITSGKTFTYSGTAISIGTSTLTITGGGTFSNSGSAITLNNPDSLLALNGTGTVESVAISSITNNEKGLDVNNSLTISNLSISGNPDGLVYADIVNGKILTIGSEWTIPDTTIFTLSGTGTLDLNGNLTLGNLAGTGIVDATGISIILGNLATTSFSLTTSNTTLVIPSGKTFSPSDTSVAANVQLAGGTLSISFPTTIEGNMTHTASSKIDLAATLTYSLGNTIDIGSYELTLAGTGGFANSNSINLDQSGSMLTLNGTNTIEAVSISGNDLTSGKIDVNTNAIIKTLKPTNATIVDIADTVTLTLNNENEVPSSSRLEFVNNTGSLSLGNTLTIAGTLTFYITGNMSGGALALNQGTLNIYTSTTISTDITPIASSWIYLGSTLNYVASSINMGSYDLTIGGTSNFANTNAIILDQVDSTLTLNNSGTITRIAVTGNDLTTGKINVNDSLTITHFLPTNTARFDIASAKTVTISNAFEIASGKTLELASVGGGTLALGDTMTITGTLKTSAPSIVSGKGIDLTGTLNIADSTTVFSYLAPSASSYITLASTLTYNNDIAIEANTLTISGTGYLYSVSNKISLDHTTSTLILAGSATVNRVDVATTLSTGKIDVTANATVTDLNPLNGLKLEIADSVTFTTTDAFEIASSIDMVATGGTWQTNGVVTLSNGYWNTRAGSLYLAGGFLLNSGTLASSSGTITFISTTINGGTLNMLGTTMSLGGNFNFSSTATLSTDSSTNLFLTDDTAFTSSQALTLSNLALNGKSLTLGSDSTDMTVTNAVDFNSSAGAQINTGEADLTLSAAPQNLSSGAILSTSGTITFSEGATFYGASTLDVSGSTLVLGGDLSTTGGTFVSNTSTILTLGNSNVTFTSDNASSIGTLNLNGNALTLGSDSSDLTVSNALDFNGLSSSRILTNNADLTLSAAPVNLSAGSITSSGGAITLSQGATFTGGTLDVTSSTLGLGGNLTMTGATLTTNSTNLTLSGNANITSGDLSIGTLSLNGHTLTIDSGMTMTWLSGNNITSGILDISGAILDIDASSSINAANFIYAGATLNLAQSTVFSLTGTFDSTANLNLISVGSGSTRGSLSIENLTLGAGGALSCSNAIVSVTGSAQISGGGLNVPGCDVGFTGGLEIVTVDVSSDENTFLTLQGDVSLGGGVETKLGNLEVIDTLNLTSNTENKQLTLTKLKLEGKTLNVGENINLTVEDVVTFTDGSILNNQGGTLNLQQAIDLPAGATITSNGGGTITLSSGGTISGTLSNSAGGTIALGASLTVATGGTISAQDGPLALNASVDLINTTGGTLELSATDLQLNGNNLNLQEQNTNLILDSLNLGGGSIITTGNITMNGATNLDTGILNLKGGGALIVSSEAQFSQTPTLSLSSEATGSSSGVQLAVDQNTSLSLQGVINLNSGEQLTLAGLTLTGDLDLSESSGLELVLNSLDTGSNQLSLGDGITVALDAALTLDGTLAGNGGTVEVRQGLSVTGTLDMQNSTLIIGGDTESVLNGNLVFNNTNLTLNQSVTLTSSEAMNLSTLVMNGDRITLGSASSALTIGNDSFSLEQGKQIDSGPANLTFTGEFNLTGGTLDSTGGVMAMEAPATISGADSSITIQGSSDATGRLIRSVKRQDCNDPNDYPGSPNFSDPGSSSRLIFRSDLNMFDGELLVTDSYFELEEGATVTGGNIDINAGALVLSPDVDTTFKGTTRLSLTGSWLSSVIPYSGPPLDSNPKATLRIEGQPNLFMLGGVVRHITLTGQQGALSTDNTDCSPIEEESTNLFFNTYPYDFNKPGIWLSKNHLFFSPETSGEQTSADEFYIKLLSAPREDVTVKIFVSESITCDREKAEDNSISIEFTPDNWNEKQLVTCFMNTQDEILVSFDVSSESSDDNYDGKTISKAITSFVGATVTDTDNESLVPPRAVVEGDQEIIEGSRVFLNGANSTGDSFKWQYTANNLNLDVQTEYSESPVAMLFAPSISNANEEFEFELNVRKHGFVDQEETKIKVHRALSYFPDSQSNPCRYSLFVQESDVSLEDTTSGSGEIKLSPASSASCATPSETIRLYSGEQTFLNLTYSSGNGQLRVPGGEESIVETLITAPDTAIYYLNPDGSAVVGYPVYSLEDENSVIGGIQPGSDALQGVRQPRNLVHVNKLGRVIHAAEDYSEENGHSLFTTLIAYSVSSAALSHEDFEMTSVFPDNNDTTVTVTVNTVTETNEDDEASTEFEKATLKLQRGEQETVVHVNAKDTVIRLNDPSFLRNEAFQIELKKGIAEQVKGKSIYNQAYFLVTVFLNGTVTSEFTPITQSQFSSSARMEAHISEVVVNEESIEMISSSIPLVDSDNDNQVRGYRQVTTIFKNGGAIETTIEEMDATEQKIDGETTRITTPVGSSTTLTSDGRTISTISDLYNPEVDMMIGRVVTNRKGEGEAELTMKLTDSENTDGYVFPRFFPGSTITVSNHDEQIPGIVMEIPITTSDMEKVDEFNNKLLGIDGLEFDYPPDGYFLGNHAENATPVYLKPDDNITIKLKKALNDTDTQLDVISNSGQILTWNERESNWKKTGVTTNHTDQLTHHALLFQLTEMATEDSIQSIVALPTATLWDTSELELKLPGDAVKLGIFEDQAPLTAFEYPWNENVADSLSIQPGDGFFVKSEEKVIIKMRNTGSYDISGLLRNLGEQKDLNSWYLLGTAKNISVQSIINELNFPQFEEDPFHDLNEDNRTGGFIDHDNPSVFPRGSLVTVAILTLMVFGFYILIRLLDLSGIFYLQNVNEARFSMIFTIGIIMVGFFWACARDQQDEEPSQKLQNLEDRPNVVHSIWRLVTADDEDFRAWDGRSPDREIAQRLDNNKCMRKGDQEAEIDQESRVCPIQIALTAEEQELCSQPKIKKYEGFWLKLGVQNKALLKPLRIGEESFKIGNCED